MKRTPRRFETAFLLSSSVVLTIWGVRQYHVGFLPPQWEAPFKFTVEEMSFQRAKSPSSTLRSDIGQIRWRQEQAIRRFVPVNAKFWIGHKGAKPDWWGQSGVELKIGQLSAVNPELSISCKVGHSTFVFDQERQKYLVEQECAVPDPSHFRGHFETLFWVFIPGKAPDPSDVSAPLDVISRSEQFEAQIPLRIEP